MLPVFHRQVHARKWPVFVIYGVIATGVGLMEFRVSDAGFIKSMFLIGLSIFAALFYFVLSRLKIVIDDHGLMMQMLLKTESLRWAEISSSNLSFEFHGHTGDVKWVFERITKKAFSFSPTFFSRQDLQAVAEALLSKCPKADISEKVRKMAEGKFPWYIF